tara:strand:- start:15667 stop:16455 length:789 start_codon:yes stop_codon:yes gene_type:complete
MSKKKLLNESQVRQFMKLAKLEPLTPGFVNGLSEDQGAVDKEDEHLGAKDGKEADKKQSLKDRRKEERGEDRALGKKPAGVKQESHGRGKGEGAAGYGSPDANTRLEEEDHLEADLDATEDELGDMDVEADAEGEEIDDLEADLDMDVEAPAPAEGRMVAVDDFLAALETALEDAMGEEVEIDSEEVEDEAPVDDVEMDVELTDDGAEMDMGIEMEDPEELVNEVANRVQSRLNGMKNEAALVERVTKQVAARILKKALAKK